jgi:hypothetical protein
MRRIDSALSLARVGVAVSAALLFAFTVTAQTFSSNAGGRPAESKTGAAGVSTYARDKIETVNLVNGNFSMNVPLATIGGRGSAAFSINLSYNSKVWSVDHRVEIIPVLPMIASRRRFMARSRRVTSARRGR